MNQGTLFDQPDRDPRWPPGWTPRYPGEPPPIAGADPRARRTDPDVSHEAAAAAVNVHATHRRKIIAALTASTEPMSYRDLAAALDVDPADAERPISDMLYRRKDIVVADRAKLVTGRRGRRFVLYDRATIEQLRVSDADLMVWRRNNARRRDEDCKPTE